MAPADSVPRGTLHINVSAAPFIASLMLQYYHLVVLYAVRKRGGRSGGAGVDTIAGRD